MEESLSRLSRCLCSSATARGQPDHGVHDREPDSACHRGPPAAEATPSPPHLLSHHLRVLPGDALEGTWGDLALDAEAQGLGRGGLQGSFFSLLIPQTVVSAYQGPGSVSGDTAQEIRDTCQGK